jgi:adenylate cyclase
MALIGVTAFWVLDPLGTVTATRESAFEAIFSVLPRQQTSDAVAVVDIDRETLATVEAWPWRRATIARLLEQAEEAGGRAVAIDILLTGGDRKGPAGLARELAELAGRPDLAQLAVADDDQQLAAAIAGGGNVVLGLVLDELGADLPPISTPLSVEGDTAGIAPRTSAGLVAPYEPLALGAAGVGVLSVEDGPLGRVIAAPVLAIGAGQVFPGFALEAVRVAAGATHLVLKDQPSRVTIGEIDVPIDPNAEMRLYPSARSNWEARTVSAARLLAGDPDAAARLAGKIAVIGSSAPEAGALLPVAGVGLMPTVQLQADLMDQIMLGRFLQRPSALVWWEAGAMLVLGTAAIVLAALSPPSLSALLALVLVGLWLIAVAALLRLGLLVDPVGPAAATLLGANVTAFAAFIRTRALKASIQSRFERYVPPEVVARFLREPQTLKLDGELREVTAMLTDIEGFSGMTERSEPRMLVSVLDGYFDRVTELIVAHGGMVDKIVGDAVLAFFNIPAELPNHPQAAVRCALAVLETTEAYRREAKASALGLGRTRCGIETGTAIVGDVGGKRRLDYTAYGVVVNKAARFQDANKALKSSICIGPEAAAKLGGTIPLRPLGRITARGMQGLAEVYEPWRAGVPDAARTLYGEAVKRAENEPEKAQSLFAEVGKLLPDDPVVKMWLEKLSPRPIS